ncbi:MAG: hypothetical protein IJ856_00400 [Candidatus Methanomethylophilaceae archaeon]|nr:hypothetical protein [Candidatus Methanomethylophilaceae archaeon]
MNTESLLYDLFGGFGGDAGVLLGVFLIFLIDALIFPALPEVFFILGYDYNPEPWYGALLICAAVLAEVIGIFSLAYVVRRVRVPRRIKAAVDRYLDFLIVSDEKVFLVNRVAPMIPFAGAFIGMVDRWDRRKCLFYIVLGCVLKYGVILLATGLFYEYFTGRMALRVTIAFVIAVIAISFVASYLRKRKEGLQRGSSTSTRSSSRIAAV